MTSSVMVALRVKASPEHAFDVFTKEIASWWKPSSLFTITPKGDGHLVFEGEKGGRLIATFANTGNESQRQVFEIGRITEWVRGQRLAFTWRQSTFTPDMKTRVEVIFEPVGDETRVTVRHEGWLDIPHDHAARHGFPDPITQRRAAEWWQGSLARFAAKASSDGPGAKHLI